MMPAPCAPGAMDGFVRRGADPKTLPHAAA
jgi:hypothetical protein